MEQILKLQPHRTIHLRGFDGRGAAAAITRASDAGFTVRGVFRDMADFAVVVLWDADNFFEHHRMKYLPDFDFSGMVLEFDLHYSGLQPIDSLMYNWIDWASLDYITESGDSGRLSLADRAVPLVEPSFAEASVRVMGNDPHIWDRLTLWFMNYAFDYYLDKKVLVEFAFFVSGPGTQHFITVEDRIYGYIEQAGDTSAGVASILAGKVNGSGGTPDPEVSAEIVAETPWVVRLKRKLDNGDATAVNASGNAADTIYQIGPLTIAQAITDQINAADYSGVTIGLTATRSGDKITIRANRPGDDGNRITLYTQSTGTMAWDASVLALQGGSSGSSWHVKLDFSQIGLTGLRKLWMTLAPRLPQAEAYRDTEWEAVFANWTVADPLGKRPLKVAGPGSVLIHSRDSWCKYSGSWDLEAGWYYGGFARRAFTHGDSVTVRYFCQYEHELWLGTSLYKDRGMVGITLDGIPLSPLSCLLDEEPPVVTRRRIATAVPPGEHLVTITLLSSAYFYFDYLEAVVPSDVPDPDVTLPDVTAAVDYDTDHTYKLPPARLLWNLDQLGLHGEVNEYVGVFWWNQRKRVGGGPAYRDVSFTGPFTPGDSIYLLFGQTDGRPGLPAIGKTVFPADTDASIGRHFMYAINATFVACWAEIPPGSNGSTIRIWQHTPQWVVYLSAKSNAGGSITGASDMLPAPEGTWLIDHEAAQPINVAAREWHAEFFRLLAEKGWKAVVAFSMELVDPPEAWAARYADGTPVTTATGFGTMVSTHCSFVSGMLAYQQAVYGQMAALMAAAGLPPKVQFGEFLWWFFAKPGVGMAYYDAETKAAAQTALGRELHVFMGPDDDPSINGWADANFLQARLHQYVAALRDSIFVAVAGTLFEMLLAIDVNYPKPVGNYLLGGRLNHHVNLPPEWRHQETAPFDFVKMEALDFGAGSRNAILALEAIRFPYGTMFWDRSRCRYNLPLFNGGCPWEHEFALARGEGLPVMFWAFDHVCLFTWRIQEGILHESAQVL